MILLREKLAELLFRQSWNDDPMAAMAFNGLPQSIQERYLVQADEIIELFADAIRNLEFKA